MDAAERLTVNVNEVLLLFLPSALVTSLMVIRGGVGWTVQLPSLSRIATLPAPPAPPATMFAAAASGRPSPLKSAMTRELAKPPVAGAGIVIGAESCPSP